MTINKKIADYFERRFAEGKTMFILEGGRRSGKTFFACQFLLGRLSRGEIVNMASMTQEQGRLGAYADCKTIINDNYAEYYNIGRSPRQIESRYMYKGMRGTMFFNSYDNPETAKGIACDWLFINEANNFTKQQFTDLMANVRKGVILDYNPNCKFWIEDYLESDADVCHTTWQDNARNLTDAQLKYFADLKRLGDKPDANPVDRRNYLVYYCGQYAEITGKIFHAGNIRTIAEEPDDLRNFAIFADPSALRGADWFPLVLSAYSPSLDKYVIVRTDTTNTGSRELRAKVIKGWCAEFDRVTAYIETNGIIGAEFFDYCVNSDLPVLQWYSRGAKFERIVAEYEDITEHTLFLETEGLDEFLAQVYDFDERCEHDDNIDAVASSIMAQKLLR